MLAQTGLYNGKEGEWRLGYRFETDSHLLNKNGHKAIQVSEKSYKRAGISLPR